MMKRSLGIIAASICFIFGLSIIGSAQTETPGVQTHHRNQQKRIFQGLKSGSITRKEFKQLQKGQIQAQKAKKRAKADGEITNKEKIRLNKIKTNNSRRIYRAKHNNRNRP